jgi:hypothetical protein
VNTISLAINLPSDENATPLDFSMALRQASDEAMMRGDLMGAKAIVRLQMLIQLPRNAPTEYYIAR